MGITREEAKELMFQMIQNQNLRRHGLAVEAIMRALAKYLKEKHPEVEKGEFDEEEWGIVGLIHDADYELIEKDPTRHTLVTAEKLGPFDVSERIVNGIKAHHSDIKSNRENYLEKAVYAADELSGLITACALVQPDKKLSSVSVESVLKKFKTPSFAAGAKRESILACESELNIKLDEFASIALKAMQGIHEELGL